ncbi:unnamed protein product [Trifolium pratense]|uniref:Uncharacterized protein n=1 Tax=Trifolium pratense TaxID=57577 RepID=A0ACB0LLY4_TRIPR|nr:unnamed protein product [Trifolium pratense]
MDEKCATAFGLVKIDEEGRIIEFAEKPKGDQLKAMKVQAYLYDGYWEDIGTIEDFYNAILGITKKPVPDFSFFDRLRYLPPSKMLDADITDSVIGEGCVIKRTWML